jgi:hypothetical protein
MHKASHILRKGSENVPGHNTILTLVVFLCKKNYLQSSGFLLHKLDRHHLPASQTISRNSKCVWYIRKGYCASLEVSKNTSTGNVCHDNLPQYPNKIQQVSQYGITLLWGNRLLCRMSTEHCFKNNQMLVYFSYYSVAKFIHWHAHTTKQHVRFWTSREATVYWSS